MKDLKKKNGCGCGDTSAMVSLAGGCSCGSSSGCKCGSAECEKCGVTTMVRPRFFPGQLLVDGDLQLLTDYASLKHRLHNRFLHGAGVVCGLQVACHPCGGGKVVVTPGMALDCCGNDIIVPCPVELDINRMIRDLRLSLQPGYDCGDPCDETADPADAEDPRKKMKSYCLWVRYCEEMTDPIAPYTTDDRCSNIACQPSRVREGYSFELRCSEKDDPPDTLWDRILCCIGDLEEAVKASSDANAVGRFHDKAAFASQQIKINAPVPFEQIDVDVLSQGTQRLQRFTGERQMAAETAEIDIRNGLDDLQSTASAIVRWDLQSNKESLAAKLGAAAENVEAARRAVQTAAPVLAKAAAARITSDRDRVFAEESTGQALKWTKPNATFIETEDVQRKFFAYNAGYSVKSMSSFSSVMIQLRDWLIQAIDKRGLFGDCKLRDEVLTLEIPTNAKTPADTQKAAYSLRKAIVEYFKDCFCAALNPPCLPCDETAVKLACLEVENCEVTEICNLERTFVLSGPAFRYWNPFINLIGRFFEWLCCEFEFKTKEGPTEGTIDIRQHQYFKQTAPASRVLDDQPAILTVARMAGMEPATARLATDLGASMAFMVRDQVDLDPMGLLGDFRGFQIRGGRERTGDDEIVTLRRRVDELDKEVIQLKAKRSRTEKNK